MDNMAVLASPTASLAQIMNALGKVEKDVILPHQASIGLSSSTTVDLLAVLLRRQAVLSGVRLKVAQGNYDDPIGDIDRFMKDGVEHMVLLPFFDNLRPSFEAQIGHLDPDVVAASEAELRARYGLAFAMARGFKTVFVGLFHRFGDIAQPGGDDAVAPVLNRFNQVLRAEAAAFANVRLIDMEDIVRVVGHSAAFDQRFYFRGKAPYTTAFLGELARRIFLLARGFGSYFYKALVLDCDNTLWGGVIGEDLLQGIKLTPFDYPGNIFWRMQHEFAEMERSGILLCLCSKNNQADVDEVLRQHPDMVLKEENIILKKLNWNEKTQSLREIAQELNISLDSLIFLDDSDFECNAVRSQLPMVRTLQVPATLSDYPYLVQEIKELFLAGGISADSRSKTDHYRTLGEAQKLKERFESHEDYLASLELKVALTRNSVASTARISELTQKSNQFNLTTRRYSESEITAAIGSSDTAIYSLVVSDKFGGAGLTGVAVLRYAEGTAHVDAFLMSCRVIGRGVEFAIWDDIVRQAIQDGCSRLAAEYRRTAKNTQVADFYDRLGLTLIDESDGVRRYAISLDEFTPPRSPWIEVSYDG